MTITLPPETRADRIAKAVFSAEDIAAILAFASSLSEPGRSISEGQVITIPAAYARLFWLAGQARNPVAFNRATLEYLRRGAVIRQSLVKAAAEAAVNHARARIYDAALRLQQGKLDVVAWTLEHNAAVKTLVGAESALARGGLAQMAQTDWDRASELVARQYGYSRAFFEDVAGGRYGVPGDTMGDIVLRRAGMYADYGRAVYENTQVENARDRLGHTKARRILAAVENCPGCVAEAEKGWQDIEDVSPIGGEQCLSNCHCIIITGVEGNLVD